MNEERKQQLTEVELDGVTGGFKYDPNYVSQDTIDARGGQFQYGALRVTFDINGNVSSVSPAT